MTVVRRSTCQNARPNERKKAEKSKVKEKIVKSESEWVTGGERTPKVKVWGAGVVMSGAQSPTEQKIPHVADPIRGH